jgi:hypothetical protein
VCDVSSKKKGDVFFPARKAADECWGVVLGINTFKEPAGGMWGILNEQNIMLILIANTPLMQLLLL